MQYYYRNKRSINIALAGFVVFLIWIFSGSTEERTAPVLIDVLKGTFKVTVTTTGELQAKSSEKIIGPSGLRTVSIWNVNITDLVPEGTYVKKGDYIGALDKSEITNKLSEVGNELIKLESKYIQTRLDTALELRKTRDEIINLEFSLEENKIALEQSKYEPPATIRQTKINLEKSQRAFVQAIENYKLKKELSDAKTSEVAADLSELRRKRAFIIELMGKFDIVAPKDGMLIYVRNWDGSKKTVGASISPWQPEVAELPDLSVMISKTYINEVDISKVEEGQEVTLEVDAFPNVKYIGKVIYVANVGEQLKNSEAKVFEVRIMVDGMDTTLRPSMTTSNIIHTNEIEDAFYIPLECLHSNDSIIYVYKKSAFSLVKQQVLVGITNENEAVINSGLEEGDVVYLSVPEGAQDKELEYIE